MTNDERFELLQLMHAYMTVRKQELREGIEKLGGIPEDEDPRDFLYGAWHELDHVVGMIDSILKGKLPWEMKTNGN